MPSDDWLDPAIQSTRVRTALVDKKGGSRRTPLHKTIEAAAGLLAAVAVFVLYLRTLAPTVLYYDYPDMRTHPPCKSRLISWASLT